MVQIKWDSNESADEELIKNRLQIIPFDITE